MVVGVVPTVLAQEDGYGYYLGVEPTLADTWRIDGLSAAGQSRLSAWLSGITSIVGGRNVQIAITPGDFTWDNGTGTGLDWGDTGSTAPNAPNTFELDNFYDFQIYGSADVSGVIDAVSFHIHQDTGNLHIRILTYPVTTPTNVELDVYLQRIDSSSQYPIGSASFVVQPEEPPVVPPPIITQPEWQPDWPTSDPRDNEDGGEVGRVIRGATTTAATTPAVATPTAITAASIQNLVQQALQAAAAGQTPAVQLTNPTSVTLAQMQSFAATAGRAITINADTLLLGSNTVDVRVAVNPALVTGDLNLSASTTSPQALQTSQIFQTHFGGAKTTVSLGQQGSFGMEVRLATRLNPDLDVNNLHFYAFNSAANTFTRFTPTTTWADPHGFFHFTTSLAGDIVISNTQF